MADSGQQTPPDRRWVVRRPLVRLSACPLVRPLSACPLVRCPICYLARHHGRRASQSAGAHRQASLHPLPGGRAGGRVHAERSSVRRVRGGWGLSAGVDSGTEEEREMTGRVAVIHDWLTGMRGGEAVLEAILDLVPDADLFTLFHFPGSVSSKIESRNIITSNVQKLARTTSDYRRLLPLFPHAVRKWDLSAYDLVVSSSHCVAKGVNARGLPHLSYCHTPMRYIWDRFDDYFPRSRPLRRAAAMSIAPWLRRWDVTTANEVTRFVANSRFVRDRIQRYYKRDAEVVHPYVDDAFLSAPIENERGDYHVIVSALVPYKKVELAFATGKKLVVIGGGPLFDG